MSETANAVLAASCAAFTLLNFAIFGFTLKLYTEILKDQSQNRRVSAGSTQR